MLRVVLVALFFNCFWGLMGQVQKQFAFAHYETRSGLPSNQINGMVQDKKGYIWMATLEGLVCYDGVRYKVFRKSSEDSTSFPMRAVGQIMMDYKGRLWVIGGYSKVGIFDTEKHVFKAAAIQPLDSALVNAPKGLIEGVEGQVLLGIGTREILAWDEATNTFRPAIDLFPSQPEWKIHGFGVIPDSRKFWVVINNKLAVYNRDTKNLSTSENNVEKEPLVDKFSHLVNFNAVLFDKKNRFWAAIWIGGGPRVYCLDLNTGKFLLEGVSFSLDLLNAYYELHAFHEQQDGTIWVRGLGVLAYFNESKNKFEHILSGTKPFEEMTYETAHAFFEDREHNIWVGTDGAGLYRFNPSKAFFTNVYLDGKGADKKIHGSPQSFLMDSDSSVLVGFWGDGLFRFNRDLEKVPTAIKGLDPFSTTAVWDMCHDRDGVHAWFACQPGVFKYNKVSRSGHFIFPAIFQNRTVRQVETDASGNLWFGTQGLGLFKWDARKGAKDFEKGLYKIEDVKINHPINKITIDSKGWVWVASEIAGVYVVDASNDKVLYHFHESKSGFEHLPALGVCAVLEYSDSLMIVATNSHVVYFDRYKKTTRLAYNLGDISGFIASLEKDAQGNVWMGTTTTLYRFHPSKSGLWGMDRSDGIFNDNFMLSTSLLLPDGRLMFGVSDHFIVFDPSKIKPSTELPEVSITDVKINNHSFPLESFLHQPKAVFTHEENALHIDFSTLRFNNRCTIQYQLQGIDKDWVNADKNCEANYAYLPPGTYRFYTRTMDSELHYSAEQLHFTIQILPPFYQTWWFYSLILLLAGGMIFGFDRERMKREKAVAQVRNNIYNDLHKEVNTALQNINILSEIANIKAESDPQKAKEFIAQIHSKSNQMINNMDDMLWSITPENDAVQKMTERMKELVAALNAQYDSSIEMHIDDKVKKHQLGMRERYEAFVVFKKGLQKIIKDCPSGFRLYVDVTSSQLVYTVDFYQNQAGIAQLKRDEFFLNADGIAQWWIE